MCDNFNSKLSFAQARKVASLPVHGTYSCKILLKIKCREKFLKKMGTFEGAESESEVGLLQKTLYKKCGLCLSATVCQLGSSMAIFITDGQWKT